MYVLYVRTICTFFMLFSPLSFYIYYIIDLLFIQNFIPVKFCGRYHLLLSIAFHCHSLHSTTIIDILCQVCARIGLRFSLYCHIYNTYYYTYTYYVFAISPYLSLIFRFLSLSLFPIYLHIYFTYIITNICTPFPFPFTYILTHILTYLFTYIFTYICTSSILKLIYLARFHNFYSSFPFPLYIFTLYIYLYMYLYMQKRVYFLLYTLSLSPIIYLYYILYICTYNMYI